MRAKRKFKKIRVFFITFVLLIVSVCILYKIPIYPRYISEEKHIARITEEVKERYDTNENFIVSSLITVSNPESELDHFLVEFEEGSFVLVRARPTNIILFNMYHRAEYFSGWYRYRFDLSDREHIVYQDGIYWRKSKDTREGKTCFYECDSEGKYIRRHKSPFLEAGVENETKYLFRVRDRAYVPAVKRDDKWLNLISMKVITSDEINAGDVSTMAILITKEDNL